MTVITLRSYILCSIRRRTYDVVIFIILATKLRVSALLLSINVEAIEPYIRANLELMPGLFYSVEGFTGRLGSLPRPSDRVAASSPFHVLGRPRTVDQRP